MYWCGDVEVSGGIYNSSATLTLACGTLTWVTAASIWVGSKLVSLNVTDVIEIWSDQENHFSIRSNENNVFSFRTVSYVTWITKLRRCLQCFQSEFVLSILAERRRSSSPVAIVSLQEIDESPWSVDGSLCVSEWKVLPHLGGRAQHPLDIVPLRFLSLSSALSTLDRSEYFANPTAILNVTGKRLWVCVGDRFIIVRKNVKIKSEKVPLEVGEFLFDPICDTPRHRAIDASVVVRGKNILQIWSVSAKGDLLIWNGVDNTILHRIPLGKQISAMSVLDDEVCVCVSVCVAWCVCGMVCVC